ncbi:MAG TPA: hypothetical protein VFT55_18245 [Planctomycetota bacterium]|nr:hypothetical protein [Planctomycetota bacterium]
MQWTSGSRIRPDAQNIEFRVQVPAGDEQVVTWRVPYDWQCPSWLTPGRSH